jgi:microcystin degradation protein MlrC
VDQPKIALCGMMLESNAFSPVATEGDFRNLYYLKGDTIVAQAREGESAMAMEMSAFVRTMDVTGPWEPAPLVMTGCQPWGPVEHRFFVRTVDDMVARLQAVGPVDGVYVANHGAMVSTQSHDPDGEMLRRIREVVGPQVPIILTLDLHANISEQMVECANVTVAYQTNPHVDMYERGEEAAHHMRAVFGGTAAPKSAFIRLPLTPPSVTLLTREGPYADIIDYAQRRKRELAGEVLNVSILGGFVFGDTPKNGVALIVTARTDKAVADSLVREIAQRAWNDRHRYRRDLTSVAQAVDLALKTAGEATAPALIYSDAGDNPGGGGGGNTMELLCALVDAQAKGVLFGAFFDPDLAQDALNAGVGSTIEATFNRATNVPFASKVTMSARVVAVNMEPFVGRRGIYAQRKVEIPPSCALEIGGEGGITVVVISKRHQCADPMFFEHLGLDVAQARIVCVKSRGHFRAGFDLWFEPEQVYEVDTAGLTSPVLDRLTWSGLPRPVYPLDEDTQWNDVDT